METYNVDQAFEILKQNKITKQKESVRRWLRDGKIKAEAPTSKKAGWKIPKHALDNFIKERLPDSLVVVQASIYDYDTTNDVIADTVPDDADYLPDDLAAVMGVSFDTTNDAIKKAREATRVEMWWELANKNIFEGFVEIKKSSLKACVEHRRYSQHIFDIVWERCVANSAAIGYKKPRVPYLLEAFKFEGQRLLFDDNFEDQEERVIFAIMEHVRLNIVNGAYND